MTNPLYDMGRTVAKGIVTKQITLSTSDATLASLLSGFTWPNSGDGSEVRQITLKDVGEGVQYADNSSGDYINAAEGDVLPVADPLTKLRFKATSGTPTVTLEMLT